jgi:hypothetical protein
VWSASCWAVSRARGTHTPESDYDLGVYYRGRLDTGRLAALAREVAGPAARVTEPGEWGPWVDGGGWLTIDGVAVDWIYRDVDRVRKAWQDAEHGRYAFHSQAGHRWACRISRTRGSWRSAFCWPIRRASWRRCARGRRPTRRRWPTR